MKHNQDELVRVINLYYDGLFTCDTALLGQVFHPEAQYCTASSGDLLHLNMNQYFQIIRERTSPASLGESKFLKIDSIDQTGPVTAFVRLRCHMLGNAYTDFLTFLKIDSTWQIISKVFHVEPLNS